MVEFSNSLSVFKEDEQLEKLSKAIALKVSRIKMISVFIKSPCSPVNRISSKGHEDNKKNRV